ncbi:hypothetical protein ACT6QG_04510 [Xanthobacter sp. TB0136]|uniref:hypothetical protein n=1 Tax=Xanthobacter sp. TB0136 TaxID=3459177 RepID=UPI00403A663A
MDRLEEDLLAICGSSAALTGIHAAKGAASHIGWTPRLFAVPGYTHQVLGAGEANPVVAEFPAILDQMRAVAAVEGPSGNLKAAQDWRETFTSNRLIPMAGGVKVRGGESAQLQRPMAGRILGVAVRAIMKRVVCHFIAGRASRCMASWRRDGSMISH